MARDSRQSVASLEEEFVSAVVKDTGFQPSLALIVVRPIINHLVANYAGDRLYVPAPRRQYPVAEILQALEATGNRQAVCERFGISDSTLYRITKGATGDDPSATGED